MTFPKVLVIGWDAADWKVITPLMHAGKMPNIQRLIEQGSTGPIATIHPPLSPMLWTSIASGKRPFKHGIHGFCEPTPDGRWIQPVTNLSRKTKAVWNILNQQGKRSAVVGWWPSHPAEPIDGVMVSDHYHRAHQPLQNGWPLLRNTVHPPELSETLADLRMHPDLLTPEMIEPFIPLAREIDQDKDRRLAGCMRTLAECVSIHAAATWLLDNPLPDGRDWDFFAVYYDAIDHFCHGFMRYHPPRQSWIGERDFELYSNVVAMAYQFHDRMLGELLSRVSEETTVILLSDHGFHPDHLRPAAIPDIPAGPAIEHRDFGILAIKGPRIRKHGLFHGASVLDIAPTILTLYDLPVGEDMDGKVLVDAFQESPEVSYIPGWDEMAGNDGRHPAHTRLDPVAAHEALEQIVALGYIDKPDEDHELAVANTIRELHYNLGEAYQDADRYQEAREIFSELYAKDPDEQRFAVRLFAAAQALGMHEEMRRIVDDLDGRRRELFEQAKPKIAQLRRKALDRGSRSAVADREGEAPATEDDLIGLLDEADRREFRRQRNLARFQPPVVDYLKAQVLTAEKQYAEALAALAKVPGLFLQTADLYMKLGRWSDAEQLLRRVLAIDPDNAHAHLGICRIHLHRRQFEKAVQSALEALQRMDHYALAHYLLGLALIGLKDYPRAAQSVETAVSCNPNFPEAHVKLAWLLGKHLGDAAGAREHRRLARQMRSRKIVRAARGAGADPAEVRVVPAQPVKELPAVDDCVVVVSGLPRSGTSVLMQMLAAGGMPLMSDGVRGADEDNPRGYLEFEPVKNILQDASWLAGARGKVVKIVAPLLTALPPGLACRVILSERDLDEVLDSQEKMIERRRQPIQSTAERRRILKDEYGRVMTRVKTMLSERPATELLIVQYRDAIRDAAGVAARLNAFLGGNLDVARMAAAVDPGLHRNKNQFK